MPDRLEIGQLIEVFATVQPEYVSETRNEDKPVWRRRREWRRKLRRRRLRSPKKAIICGGTWRRTGRVVPGGGAAEDYCPGYLTDITAVFVYRATVGLTRRPFDVLPGDLKVLK